MFILMVLDFVNRFNAHFEVVLAHTGTAGRCVVDIIVCNDFKPRKRHISKKAFESENLAKSVKEFGIDGRREARQIKF